jgi:hypothetical protein
MMHVDSTIGRKDFEDFPRIRPLLARWGVLPEGSSNLTRVLSPIAHRQHPQPAIDLAADLASTLGSETVYSSWCILRRKPSPRNSPSPSAPAGRGTRSSSRAIRSSGS